MNANTHTGCECTVRVGGLSGTEQPPSAVLSQGLHDCRVGGRGARQTHHNAIIFDIFKNNVGYLTQMSSWLDSYQLSNSRSQNDASFSLLYKQCDQSHKGTCHRFVAPFVTLEKRITLREESHFSWSIFCYGPHTVLLWPICHASVISVRLFKHLLHSRNKPLQFCIIYACRWSNWRQELNVGHQWIQVQMDVSPATRAGCWLHWMVWQSVCIIILPHKSLSTQKKQPR